MSNSSQKLHRRRDLASGVIAQTDDEELEAKYNEGVELLRDLGDGNLRDWVTRQYRERYEAWQAGDAAVPCNCSDPACPLKNGRLPYAIRRDESPFSIREPTPMEDRIKGYLDDHPEAVVLSDALEELAEKKHRTLDLFEEVFHTDLENVRAEADTR
jgi:hypothetical protein